MDPLNALQLVVQILTQAQQVAAIISRAHIGNRDLTDEELDAIVQADDDARARGRALLESLRAAKEGAAGQPSIAADQPAVAPQTPENGAV